MSMNKALNAFTFTILAQNAFAGAMEPQVHEWARVVTLSIGPAWSAVDETQTFYLQEDTQKSYIALRKNKTLFDGEFFFGWQHMINSKFTGQFGLAVAGAGNVRFNGDIWEDADPDFNNYYYSYKVNHAHIAAKSKLLGQSNYFAIPYISGSLGVGFNRARDFSITSKIWEEIPAPPFTDNSTTTLVYTLGIGLQKEINGHLQAGIGYEFSDWGKSNLGAAPGQTLNTGLRLNHLYTNELQFSLSYVA